MGAPPPSRPPRRSFVSGSFYDERPFLRDYERGTGRFWRKAAVHAHAEPIALRWSTTGANPLLAQVCSQFAQQRSQSCAVDVEAAAAQNVLRAFDTEVPTEICRGQPHSG